MEAKSEEEVDMALYQNETRKETNSFPISEHKLHITFYQRGAGQIDSKPMYCNYILTLIISLSTITICFAKLVVRKLRRHNLGVGVLHGSTS